MTEGVKKPIKKKLPIIALIDEEVCTGCEVCIEFCPVDCIVVAANPNPELTNNVCRVVEDDCIGCKICVRECPWECIEMVPRKGTLSSSVVMDVSEKPLNDHAQPYAVPFATHNNSLPKRSKRH